MYVYTYIYIYIKLLAEQFLYVNMLAFFNKHIHI